MYEAYKMEASSSKATSKSRATAGNSECRRNADLLGSSAAKLAHLSLNYLIQFYWVLFVFIPSFSAVMFWTYYHEAIHAEKSSM